MKAYAFVILFLITGCSTHGAHFVDAKPMSNDLLTSSVLSKPNWHHGAKNCSLSQQAPHDIYQHDESTFIIRQNKCLTFEAPFIYVLAGTKSVLVLDTGALDQDSSYNLYQELEKLFGKKHLSSKQLLVLHSHGHSDHFQGDWSFSGQKNVTVVNPEKQALHTFFEFDEWPNGEKTIDLGDRQITVLPTPGHQEESISLYDEKNKWLLTGDTLYPGYIYIKDWASYKNSIDKLAKFAKIHEVKAILGAHIEMKNKPKLYYPIGSTFQPDEAPLELHANHLYALNSVLKAQNSPEELVFDRFIIKPMSLFQKTLSNLIRWFSA
ncbi:MBL fold metallo-hydrolase [Pseudoalteromonas sp. Of7M-16]|uniref:MBL fold metallo-hydrolase n=1 Tax=Pseudoalteromonas sp. Of7M-16 TaxID=2917756 RepID=UPI001EF6A472|nr:MBL fold metallo-hydrolase [Pseudoalteromonas sp. Of7M-16]MCG7550201.1 MBL fold metallo-hydrolase [Pseudoalteromonas sp. Of7M-16]